MVTEYLIRYCELIFSDKMPSYNNKEQHGSHHQRESQLNSARQSRPKSLAISTPTRLLSLEEARSVPYTHFDEHGTVTMGRYQDPRASMGHLISNF